MTNAIGASPPAAPPAPAAGHTQLRAVARQFEAVFLRQLVGSMRQAGLAEGVFDSSATDQFRDMADARTADAMAATGAFGIAELLVRQFAARQTSSGVDLKPAGTAAAAKAVAPPAVDSAR